MSTRQATPGSSRGVAPQVPSMNSKKRGTSEPDGDIDKSRSIKKLKKDDSNGPATKDKKKRKKRRRKMSIVTAAAGAELRPRSKSRSATAGTQNTAPESSAVTPVSAHADAVTETEDLLNGAEDAVPRIPYADKGKGKAKDESPPPSEIIESPKAQIARLQQELETQSLLLRKHQAHLTHVHQALTCQICLDLLHKPFALAPCGHVVCHSCLVRWFTASENTALEEQIFGAQEASHIHKKKKCPICRTVITERPVEVWGIKGMVTGIVRSGLVELPAPPPEASTPEDPPSHGPNGAAPDPWRNIFRRSNHRQLIDYFAPPPPRPPRNANTGEGGSGLEDMGMYDAEDGGIYRCIDCMHEIWDGVCSHCQREYPGHRGSDDEDDDDEVFFDGGGPAGRRSLRDLLNGLMAGRPNAFALADDDSESESEGLAIIDDEEDEDEGDEYGHDLVLPAGFLYPGPPPPLPLPVYPPNYGGPRLAHAPRLPLPRAPPRAQIFADFTDDEAEPGIARIEEEGQAGGEEEDGYESSFIDDGDAAETSAAGASSIRGRRGRGAVILRRRGPVVDVSDDDEIEIVDERIVVEDVARRGGREFKLPGSRRGQIDPPIMVESDNEDGEEAHSSSPVIQLPGRRNRSHVVVSSDNEWPHRRQPIFLGDEESDEGVSRHEVFDLSDESEHEPWSDGNEDDDERWYEEDGSRVGPSSRLLRMMEEQGERNDEGRIMRLFEEDEDGEGEDEDEGEEL